MLLADHVEVFVTYPWRPDPPGPSVSIVTSFHGLPIACHAWVSSEETGL
jgi:hypothetical protein